MTSSKLSDHRARPSLARKAVHCGVGSATIPTCFGEVCLGMQTRLPLGILTLVLALSACQPAVKPPPPPPVWPVNRTVAVGVQEQDSADGKLVTKAGKSTLKVTPRLLEACTQEGSQPKECLRVKGELTTPYEFVGVWRADNAPEFNTQFRCTLSAKEVWCRETILEENGATTTVNHWFRPKLTT
jgi:hypothetical protein